MQNPLIWGGLIALAVVLVGGIAWALLRPKWERSDQHNAHYGLGAAEHHEYGGAALPDDCHEACKADPLCVAWSLSPEGRCFGRYADSANVWVQQPGYSSGRKL